MSKSITAKLTSTGTRFCNIVAPDESGVLRGNAIALRGVARNAQTYHQFLAGLRLFDVRALFPPEQRHQVNNANVVTNRANGC
jgi:hypothetical protein